MGVKDISERKRAEKAFRESEEKYRDLVENLNDVVFSADTRGDVTYISPGIRRIIGYGPDEIVGGNFARYVFPDDLPLVQDRFNSVMKGEVSPSDYRVLTRDGAVRYIRSIARVLLGDGEVIGISGLLMDITDQKLIEKEKALIEDRLRQALKMEAIGHLAGGVAHGFNNMLTGIMGNAELLQAKLAGEPALVEYVDRIIVAAERAARLTGQLLAFARKGQYRSVTLDLHRFIAETIDILANTIDRRIRIERNLRAGKFTVRGDPSQLENALMNLSLNARDAMPGGGRLIFATDTIEMDRQSIDRKQLKIVPGSYIRMSVTDTGIGMQPEVQRRLFEPFFTTKEPRKGTGLGLAGVYGIIRNHGGAIEVASEPGHGSSFTIYLPITDEKAVERSAPKSEGSREGSGTILIVDDEPAIIQIARQILEMGGYNVDACGDGLQALRHYREHHETIDLVILDMIMPEMDGREAFREMKKINPRVRVLLSSGYGEDDEAQDVIRNGVRGFVHKPYRIAELTEKVREALER